MIPAPVFIRRFPLQNNAYEWERTLTRESNPAVETFLAFPFPMF